MFRLRDFGDKKVEGVFCVTDARADNSPVSNLSEGFALILRACDSTSWTYQQEEEREKLEDSNKKSWTTWYILVWAATETNTQAPLHTHTCRCCLLAAANISTWTAPTLQQSNLTSAATPRGGAHRQLCSAWLCLTVVEEYKHRSPFIPQKVLLLLSTMDTKGSTSVSLTPFRPNCSRNWGATGPELRN